MSFFTKDGFKKINRFAGNKALDLDLENIDAEQIQSNSEKTTSALEKIDSLTRNIELTVESITQNKRAVPFFGRKEVISRCHEWCEKTRLSSSNKLLWINGAPGTGKSALAIELSHSLAEKYGAENISIFMCDSSVDVTRYAKSFLLCLIKKLSFRYDDYLNEEVLDFINSDKFDSLSIEEIYQYLICSPLNIIKHNSQIFLIIDAIDEMHEKEMTDFFNCVLPRVIPVGIRLIVLSCNELVIRKLLEGSSLTLSLNDRKQNDADISLYLKDRLPDISDMQRREIISHGEGNFLYTVCLCDDICGNNYSNDKSNIQEIFSTLPHGLEALYERMLERKYSKQVFYSEAKPILSILCVAKDYISLKDISKLLQLSINELNYRIENLYTFLNTFNDNNNVKIKLFSKSFLQFLTSTSENPFYIDPCDGIQLINDYLRNNYFELLVSDYFGNYGLEHIISSGKSYEIFNIMFETNNPELLNKIENDMFYLYQKNKEGTKNLLENLPVERVRRIILTTYRKGLHCSANYSADSMMDLLRILRKKRENFRATMLEGERYQYFKKYTRARKKFDDCLEIAKAQDKKMTSSWTKRQIALTYNRIGNLLLEQSDVKNAYTFYHEAYLLFEKIYASEDNYSKTYKSEYIKDFAISNSRLGDLLMEDNLVLSSDCVNQVIGYYEIYNQLCIELVEAKKNGAKRELATSYRRLGDIYLYVDYSQAYDYYLLSGKELADAANDIMDLSNSAIINNDDLVLDSDDCLDKSIRLEITKEHREPNYERELCLCYIRLFAVSLLAHDSTIADMWYRSAKDGLSKLLAEHFSAQIQKDMASLEKIKNEYS